MGIRFFCPNGHKLNVKEHLAGMVGYCPECGEKLVIPFQSTRKSSKELRASIKAASSNTENFLEPSQHTPAVLQDEDVVWYLQIPGQERYGPATGADVNLWLIDNRMTADTLVWRDGWAQWLQARDVFPEIFP